MFLYVDRGISVIEMIYYLCGCVFSASTYGVSLPEENKYRMLRKIRIAAAVVCFALVTLLFLDFTGTAHAWFGWLAKIQLLPAVLAVNAAVVAALALVTLLLGRVYCSVICPLGVMQDIAARLGRRARKNRYGYSPERRWLRWGMLALFVLLLAVGLSSLAALVAPYSAYGRIASTLLAPVWAWGNNALAYMAERATAMPSIRLMCGSRAGRRSVLPSRRWSSWACWHGATGARGAIPYAQWERCSVCCRASRF